MRAFFFIAFIVSGLTRAQEISAVAGADSSSVSSPVAVGKGRLEGRLREKGTKTLLRDVNIFLLPQKLKVVTDENGYFEFSDVEFSDDSHLVINLSGYEKFEKAVGPTTYRGERLQYYLERSNYGVYETTVVSQADKNKEATKSLRFDDFKDLPGAGKDPVKAVQNLPGVNRGSGFSSQVIIQGSDQDDTKYMIDGHEVPIVFHFFGLSSVLFPESVERVDYLAAGYGVENGRAQGGLIGLWTKEPKTDRQHGFGFIDLFNSGVMAEGPIGARSSYFIGARQSYIGFVLKQLFKNNDEFDLTVAPTYSDLSLIFNYKPNDDNQFRLTSVASSDSLKFLFKQPVSTDPSLRGEFSNKTEFFRVIPQYSYRHSASTKLSASLGAGVDKIQVNFANNYFHIINRALTQRLEWEQRATEGWKFFAGFDNVYYRANYSLRLPGLYQDGGVTNPFSTADYKEVQGKSVTKFFGFYLRNELRAPESAWTFSPNLRVDHFNLSREWVFSPRPSVGYAASESLSYKVSGGVYYQPPLNQESDINFGNPQIKSNRAWHLNFNVTKDFRGGSSQGFTLASDLFYKYLDRQITETSEYVNRDGKLVPLFYNNDGRGQVFGLQNFLKYVRDPYVLSLIYTLSNSERWKKGSDKTRAPYDQRHILNFLASKQFVRNWKVGTRLRYSTGTPVTPVTSTAYDSDNGVFIPIRGKAYSARLKDFFQCDVRVDKKWIFESMILSAYLDLQNITNRRNQESLSYNFDYSESQAVTGLPFFPVLGVEGEF